MVPQKCDECAVERLFLQTTTSLDPQATCRFASFVGLSIFAAIFRGSGEGIEMTSGLPERGDQRGYFRGHVANDWRRLFRRLRDAKVQAAAIAIRHGALDFIVHGDSDEVKAKKGTLLVPLHTILGEIGRSELEEELGKEDAKIVEIEQC